MRVSPLGDEAAPVAGAVAASQDLGLGDVAPPGQDRLQAVLLRIASERGEPVERDAAADGVEARLGDRERGCAVRDVSGRAGEALGDGGECVELSPGERRIVLVGGGEVAHDPGHAAGVDLRGLLGRHAEPAHAGVHLDVDGKALGKPGRGDGDLEPRLARRVLLRLGERAQDEDPRICELGAKRRALLRRRHAESAAPHLRARRGRSRRRRGHRRPP